jgi:hypothetical protein
VSYRFLYQRIEMSFIYGTVYFVTITFNRFKRIKSSCKLWKMFSRQLLPMAYFLTETQKPRICIGTLQSETHSYSQKHRSHELLSEPYSLKHFYSNKQRSHELLSGLRIFYHHTKLFRLHIPVACMLKSTHCLKDFGFVRLGMVIVGSCLSHILGKVFLPMSVASFVSSCVV